MTIGFSTNGFKTFAQLRVALEAEATAFRRSQTCAMLCDDLDIDTIEHIEALQEAAHTAMVARAIAALKKAGVREVVLPTATTPTRRDM